MPSASQLYSSGRWLNAADLLPLNQRRTAIVHSVEEAQVGMGSDQKTQLNLALTSRQGQPWPKTLLLNKGNSMQMVASFGDDYTFWPGKIIEVWSENVMFQGKLVPGIKVQAAPNGAAPAVGQHAQAHAMPPANPAPQASPPPSATAVAGNPAVANPGPNWQPPRSGQAPIEDDEIPF